MKRRRERSDHDSVAETKRDELNYQKSIHNLAASLRAQRSKALETNGVGQVMWTECVEKVRKELISTKKTFWSMFKALFQYMY